jgi:tetratricopeptide (TPR) repeat protein
LKSRLDTLRQFIDTLKGDVYFDSAMHLRKLHKYEESSSLFALAIMSKCSNPYLAFNYQGANCFDLKNYSEAITWYTQAINFNPQRDYKAYHNRALAKYTMRFKKSAICRDVDSALVMGDTTPEIRIFCDSAKDW